VRRNFPFSPLAAHSVRSSESIDFNSHFAIDELPDSLVKDVDGNETVRRRFEELVRNAQNKLCSAIEKLDGEGKFKTDMWRRENGGGGITRVLCGGRVFEKAGINLSVVYGSMPKEALAAATERGVNRAAGMAPGERVPFFACGISSVMHPKNPHVPTIHFNYRYFETDGGVWWFGGGSDITPAYLNEADIKHFHVTLKNACDKTDVTFYPKFKQWADDYYRIVHRNETRGLGGIFYDDLNDRDPEALLGFASDNLEAIASAYVPIVLANKDKPFTAEEKRWQQLRRGRYAEFNLVYDRGTTFGLKTGGRVESILMSLPETARWEYDHQPEVGSKEEEIMELFKHPRDWC